jgi:hypothetical protein
LQLEYQKSEIIHQLLITIDIGKLRELAEAYLSFTTLMGCADIEQQTFAAAINAHHFN